MLIWVVDFFNEAVKEERKEVFSFLLLKAVKTGPQVVRDVFKAADIEFSKDTLEVAFRFAVRLCDIETMKVLIEQGGINSCNILISDVRDLDCSLVDCNDKKERVAAILKLLFEDCLEK